MTEVVKRVCWNGPKVRVRLILMTRILIILVFGCWLLRSWWVPRRRPRRRGLAIILILAIRKMSLTLNVRKKLCLRSSLLVRLVRWLIRSLIFSRRRKRKTFLVRRRASHSVILKRWVRRKILCVWGRVAVRNLKRLSRRWKLFSSLILSR